ncbi:hypothetical protein D3C78_827820 [compost metagenome]
MADQIFLAERQHFFRRIGHLEQCARGAVHAHIGRLCGKRHGHQQGEGIGMFQLAFRLRPLNGKAAKDFGQLILRIDRFHPRRLADGCRI